MIKIVGSIIDETGHKHTKSFTSKQNRKIDFIDIDALNLWIMTALKNGYTVKINYKVTFDGLFNVVRAISSKSLIISENRREQVLSHMVNQININIK